MEQNHINLYHPDLISQLLRQVVQYPASWHLHLCFTFGV